MKKILILTALEIEYKVVRSFLTNLTEDQLEDGTIYEIGNPINCEESIVYLREGGKGNYKSALSTDKLIKKLKPNYAFFIGVAGGIKDLSLGDVIVGEKVYGYEAGKVGKKLQTRPELGKSNYRLIERAKVEARKEDWKVLLNGKANPNTKVLIGNIVAGEKVLTSETNVLYNTIKDNYNDAQAVEMEGIGFMEAIYQNGNIPSLVLRGISDLLINKIETDKTNSQEDACYNAAAFGFSLIPKLIERNPDKIISPSVRYRLRIDSDIPLKDEQELNRILQELNAIAIPDNHTITLNKIEVGSTILNLESNPETLQKLIELSRSGELSKIIGYSAQIELSDYDNSNPISVELKKSTNRISFWEELKNYFDDKLNKIEIPDEEAFSILTPRRIGKLNMPEVKVFFGAVINGQHSPVFPKAVELICSDDFGYKAFEYINPSPILMRPGFGGKSERLIKGGIVKGAVRAFIATSQDRLSQPSKLNKKYEGFIVRVEDIADSYSGVAGKIKISTRNVNNKGFYGKGFIYAIIENSTSDQWDYINSLRLRDFEVKEPIDNKGYDDNAS